MSPENEPEILEAFLIKKLVTIWVSEHILFVWSNVLIFKLSKAKETNVSWEICMQVRKQQLELDMEQQTGSR